MKYRLTKKQIRIAVQKAARALADYCLANNLFYMVTGVSGGLDSAVTIALAQRAVLVADKRGQKLFSVGLILPCQSSPLSVELAREAINKFKAEEIFVDLTDAYLYLKNNMITAQLDRQIKKVLQGNGTELNQEKEDWNIKIAEGNIKARLRMITNYHTAKMLNGLVLSTDNLSEYWMGFWTICGDVGDFGVIQNILKGWELYDIARYLGVPEGIIKAKPDDGLGIAGGDEDQLGANYEIVDRVMIGFIQNGLDINGSINQINNLPVANISDETAVSLAKRCLASAYKRQGTFVLTRDFLGLPKIKEIES